MILGRGEATRGGGRGRGRGRQSGERRKEGRKEGPNWVPCGTASRLSQRPLEQMGSISYFVTPSLFHNRCSGTHAPAIYFIALFLWPNAARDYYLCILSRRYQIYSRTDNGKEIYSYSFSQDLCEYNHQFFIF